MTMAAPEGTSQILAGNNTHETPKDDNLKLIINQNYTFFTFQVIIDRNLKVIVTVYLVQEIEKKD